MQDSILGWKIDPDDRAVLLARFVPRYAETIADHVTHGRASKAPPMPEVGEAVVIGRADDGEGVEALVVTVAGEAARWDGSTYHITWSLEPGRAARESNDVIAAHGWEAVDPPARVRLTPSRWP